MRWRGRPAAREFPLQAGLVRRVDAVHRAGVPYPHHDGGQADRFRGRPLPARAGDHVQKSGEGRPPPEPVRAAHLPRHPARAPRGAVPHAPVPVRVPLAVFLRRLPAERRDPQRAPLRRHRLPVAAAGHADVFLQLDRRRGNLGVGHIVLEPHGGEQHREIGDVLLEGWGQAVPGGRHHAVRRAARLHLFSVPAPDCVQPQGLRGDRSRKRGQLPRPRKGLHFALLREVQPEPRHWVPQRPAASERGSDARKVRPHRLWERQGLGEAVPLAAVAVGEPFVPLQEVRAYRRGGLVQLETVPHHIQQANAITVEVLRPWAHRPGGAARF
mmetsp:Transcript_56805/g.172958  ORF Transcript_56805/g.172958 Transcript_56805/m.172958 type:complete len:327 (+) Transcript_56805:1960-2940(+)